MKISLLLLKRDWNGIKVELKKDYTIMKKRFHAKDGYFFEWITFYVLFIIVGGIILIGNQFFRKWGCSLVMIFIVYVTACEFIIKSCISGKKVLFCATSQWWILGVGEGITLGGIFLTSGMEKLFKNFNFDNSIDLSYVVVSLIPILFASIHVSFKIEFGERPNGIPKKEYQRLQSFFKDLIGLSFFVSIILSLGSKPQSGGSVAYVNYLISFFIIMALNKIILTQFYQPI